MSSGFKKPITINDAINKIHKREYLLPAIQRKFIWSSEQVEMLFDSIMRGYPISSFMFWKIADGKIKSNYKFYEFITEYKEYFNENNTYIDTKNVPDFEAVIDGQQRLTALYIGLKGSYAYKIAKKWWVDNEENFPPRKLYLNLIVPINQECDSQKKFDFRFLSKQDIEGFEKETEKYFWFEVGDILNLDSEQKVKEYLKSKDLLDNKYAESTLEQLYHVIYKEKLINYYLEESAQPDKVLEIFIRTNSGGTPLSFSDLLMSIASENWETIDARQEIEKLIKEIRGEHLGFNISQDFILKTFLVLFIDNIRFELKNFTRENVKIFEEHWEKTRESIVSAFKLFKSLGFNNQTFRAKNAAIPIIYYIYYNDLQDKISSPIYKDKENRNRIEKWLLLTFIKSIFGGHSDTALKKMRDVLKENKGQKFPDDALKGVFESDPNKNYHFGEEFIDSILDSQKGSNDAYYILHLLSSHLDFSGQNVDVDHLHPATIFSDKKKFNQYIPEEIQAFAREPKNWNGIANLQLLNDKKNISKSDTPLKEWVAEEKKTHKDLFLSEGISLEIEDFEDFITDRKKNIKKELIKILKQ